jgi:hypothetical protein
MLRSILLDIADDRGLSPIRRFPSSPATET